MIKQRGFVCDSSHIINISGIIDFSNKLALLFTNLSLLLFYVRTYILVDTLHILGGHTYARVTSISIHYFNFLCHTFKFAWVDAAYPNIFHITCTVFLYLFHTIFVH